MVDRSSGALSIKVELAFPPFHLNVEHEIVLEGVTGLFGPSGSGKSTLLRIIAGFERSAIGSVCFANETWQDSSTKQFVPAHRRPVGYVFQHARLFEHLSVEGNLQFAAKRSVAERNTLDFQEVLSTFDLLPLLSRRIDALSGGERQRVAIARTLLSQPRLLLLDEPMAALDAGRKMEILPYLETLSARFGIPAIYVSHSVDDMAQLADRILVLQQGKLVASGDPADILNSPALQTPLSHFDTVSILQTSIIEHLPEVGLTTLEHRGHKIVVPLLTRKNRGDAVRLYVRAGDIALATQRPEKTSFRNVLPGTLASIDQGTDSAFVIVSMDIDGVTLRARLTRQAMQELKLAPGMEVFALLKTASFDRRV